jgi:hypothetical protein
MIVLEKINPMIHLVIDIPEMIEVHEHHIGVNQAEIILDQVNPKVINF